MLGYEDSPERLVPILEDILTRLEIVGLFATTCKCEFFARERLWCGNVSCSEQVSHDPGRVQGLDTMRGLRTAGELVM